MLSIGAELRIWYGMPELRRSSGGVRLSTVATVGAGRIRWVPAGLRVEMRVQSRDANEHVPVSA
jgi:hypothetical protein